MLHSEQKLNSEGVWAGRRAKGSRLMARALFIGFVAMLPSLGHAWEKKDVIGIWNYTLPAELLPEDQRAELPEMSSTFDFWEGADGKIKGYYVNLYKIRVLYAVKLEGDVLSVQNEKVSRGANGGSGPIDKNKKWHPEFEYQHRGEGDIPLVFNWTAIPTDKDVPDGELTGDYTGQLISDVNGKSKTKKSTVTLKMASATDEAGGRIRLELEGGTKGAEAPQYKIKLIDRFHNQIYFEWDEPGGGRDGEMGTGAFLGTISAGKLRGIINTKTGNGRALMNKVRK